MPIAAIRIYLERCPGVRAEQKLLNFEANAAVWMDSFDRRGLLESWEREAFGEAEVKKATRKDLQRIGISVE